MIPRILSCLIGYVCGCFLTAELVARHYAKTSAAQLGDTGNPGMANIMAALGFKPGMLVLAGDLGKCVLAALVSWLLFGKSGRIIILYAGMGCTLGHDFPFWRKFRGGKGVATSSAAITLFDPFWSLIAHLFGILVTFTTKYLCLAGPVVPLAFCVCMLITRSWEAAVLSGVFVLLALYCHGSSILGIRSGKTKQTDVIGAIRRKMHKKQSDQPKSE